MTPGSLYRQGREQTQRKSNLFHIESGVYYGPWTYLLPSITLKRSYNHSLWPDIHYYIYEQSR